MNKVEEEIEKELKKAFQLNEENGNERAYELGIFIEEVRRNINGE